MAIIHCLRKDRKWLTYCGRSLDHFAGRLSHSQLKAAFGYHQNSDAFISGKDGEDFDRKCLTCLHSARVEKKRAILKAVALAEKKFPKWTRPPAKWIHKRKEPI